MTHSLIKKIGHALCELPRAFQRTRQPRLLMTLLVKDEEQLLEANLRFHKAQGVDGFIITNNNSTDHTPDIIEAYRQKGWVLEVINEPGTNYAQKRWVDRMVWLAKKKYHADWVINADADEFWHIPGGLKEAMTNTTANVLAVTVRNVLPEDGKPWNEWDKTVRYVPEREAYGLSLYSVFAKMYKKVCHRTDGYLQISMGNHKVAMLPHREQRSDIIIYHYHVRERQHFLQKMINGGKQLEQNPSSHGGRHWRYYYELYKNGKLEEEYDRVIGKSATEQLQQDGYIHQDNLVPGILKEIGHGKNV